MFAKAVFVLCAQALLTQSALSQCLDAPFFGLDGIGYGAPCDWAGRGWGYDGRYDWPARGLGCGPALDFTSTSGGSLVVTSSSPIPPVGISIVSDNVYEGILAAAGEVPFIGTTGMEGALPTVGAGAINYGCGNGATAMAADTLAAPGIAGFAPLIGAYGPEAIAPAAIAPGLGFGCGCGCY